MLEDAENRIIGLTVKATKAAEKKAAQPMGSAIPAPAAPAMAGAAPAMPAMAGAPAGGAPMDPSMMDPAMMGGAPMDPAMMGGAPMDPAMMGGAPPLDPAMLEGLLGGEEGSPEEPVAGPNDPGTDVNNDGKADTMVPLAGIKDFTVGVIEATKGRKTREAGGESESGGGGGGQPEPEAEPQGLTGSLGAAPAKDPVPMLPKLSELSQEIDRDFER